MKVVEENYSMDAFEPWSGAIDTYNFLAGRGLLRDLEMLLEELYPEGMTIETINDLLWFESDVIYEHLGIEEDEEEEET